MFFEHVGFGLCYIGELNFDTTTMRPYKRMIRRSLLLFTFLFSLTALFAQSDNEYIKVTEKGVTYEIAGWDRDLRVIYNPYQFTYYVAKTPELAPVSSRKDYYVEIGALERPPIFSFDGTCLLEEENQLECSNDDFLTM
jgi:hypothetical protein